jgi:hypothetical protein
MVIRNFYSLLPFGAGLQLFRNPYSLLFAGARATGTITCVGQALIIDGETVTVADGNPAHTPRVYEFRAAGAFTPGNVPVQLAALDSATTVATKLAAAINAEFAAARSGVRTTPALPSPTIPLENIVPSTAANIAITETVVDVGFLVTGMAGGLAPIFDVAAPLLWGPGQRGFTALGIVVEGPS